ncbi:unnamed protein product [Orchesella dallaii]|uniref:Uncharacterized protein n=1 Tax=Orchesella dallaii TaxID=48710 RepID=A0ABP1RKI0_9HEXA
MTPSHPIFTNWAHLIGNGRRSATTGFPPDASPCAQYAHSFTTVDGNIYCLRTERKELSNECNPASSSPRPFCAGTYRKARVVLEDSNFEYTQTYSASRPLRRCLQGYFFQHHLNWSSLVDGSMPAADCHFAWNQNICVRRLEAWEKLGSDGTEGDCWPQPRACHSAARRQSVIYVWSGATGCKDEQKGALYYQDLHQLEGADTYVRQICECQSDNDAQVSYPEQLVPAARSVASRNHVPMTTPQYSSLPKPFHSGNQITHLQI